MSNNSKSISVSLSGPLTIAFIVLKLCSVITWSWWWVLAPLWLPVIVVMFVALLCFIIGVARK
jgi:hypothetical protein